MHWGKRFSCDFVLHFHKVGEKKSHGWCSRFWFIITHPGETHAMAMNWTKEFHLIWIYHFLRPIDNNFQSTSCIIWHTSAFSACLPSLRMSSWHPCFHWPFLMRFWWTVDRWTESSSASQVLCQVLAGLFSYFSRRWLSDTVYVL